MWEIDWEHKENTGCYVLARNPSSFRKDAREWKLTSTGYLRERGINTPIYRKDSWEIDWNKRNGKLVWGRNELSKMPSARSWHWIDFHTVEKAGIKWKPFKIKSGRHLDSRGYVTLNRCAMTNKEIELADKHGLFRGKRKSFLKEHHLVAVKKYGEIPKGCLVRHRNGIKSDNRPSNLLLGTTQENTCDHNTARLKSIYWREKYMRLKNENINVGTKSNKYS